jgi:hypothetical protein
MKLLILTSFILIATFSFAQLGSTMFGLARNSPSGVFLATMDPTTGMATNISPTSISSSINLTGAALNPYTNQFCFFGDNGLKSIDLFTGLESNTATINNPNGTGYFDLFRFNTSDSLMYGLSRRNIPNPQTGGLMSAMYLATIDANTGTINEISPSSIGQSFAYSGSAIDPHQMVFYYSTGAQLVGLDMYTGGIFSNPTLTFPNGGQNFDNFTYSCADTALYGLVRDVSTIHLGKVNAMTGVVTKISTQAIGVTSYSVNGSATIDPVNMIYYFISGSGTGLTIYGVSLQTGLVVSQGTISNTGALYFDMIRIQSDCYESTPTRVAPSASLSDPLANQTTIQVFPNPTTDVVQIIANQNIDKELIQLLDVYGKVVIESLFSGTQTQLDLSKLAPGTYYLKSNNLLDLVYKIVKE